MWNDIEEPLAYLITFRTYGTWLPGDDRGSIDRFHNLVGGPRAVSSVARQRINAERLKSPPFKLNAKARSAVESAIVEVCLYKQWPLSALSIRTNHAHAVVYGTEGSARILNSLKAYATRRLRERGLWGYEHSPWVDKGSRRNLWTEVHLATAVNYVFNGQGDELPEFD